ncbi:MAG: hypothetical protein KBD83_05620 [Gammaproteobacteria bacterium]|nr:hypothetical protein [Gammaproteobacteria bacterium]
MFKATAHELYYQGLTLFLKFLADNSPKKNEHVKIRDCRDALILFSSRLDLYNWDFIADKLRKLSNKYLPAAKKL